MARLCVAPLGDGTALCGATALGLNQIAPTDGLSSPELLPALAVKVILALAVYLIAARALSHPELSEGARSLRSLMARGGPGR